MRLALMVSLGLLATVRPVIAFADDDDEEEEDDDDDGDDEESDEEEDEDQPPVTAGGLFTKETYPQQENQRPLTITRKMTELRAGIDINMSSSRAFKDWGFGLDFRHGLEDNVEIQAGLRSDLNHFDSFNVYGAIEFSIVYDLVDFRAGLAIPYTKTIVPPATEATSQTGFDIEIGFPFRYAPKPEVAVVALDTFMTFNFVGDTYMVMDKDGNTVELNAKTPDLTPSLGVVVQPHAMLALKLNAKLIIKDFNTDAGNFQVPVSLNVQFSPTNLFDMGGEFTFPNLKVEDPEKFYDKRFLLLYGQIRI